VCACGGGAACWTYGQSEFFFDTVNSTRTFATGGSTHVEIWLGPHEHGATMREGLEEGWAGAHQESCTSYNILKVSQFR